MDDYGRGYGRLAASTGLLVAALALGVKVNLTPINRGGGNKQNVKFLGSGEDRTTTADAVPLGEDGLRFEALAPASPSWQIGNLMLSTLGWDAWYWDHGVHGQDEENYERYALNVWPTEDPTLYFAGGGILPTQTSEEYRFECARRKSLGVVAFASGIGEWLAKIDAVLQGLSVATEVEGFEEAMEGLEDELEDLRVTDVVDVVELGNELENFWSVGGLGISADEVRWGQMEVGRYMALIAGPIRKQVPEMRFRVAELAAWEPDMGNLDDEDRAAAALPLDDTFAAKVKWLPDTVLLGMTAEVARWNWFVQFLGPAYLLPRLPDDVVAWSATFAEAGYAWPQRDSSFRGFGVQNSGLLVTDLVRELGFHFYHGYDRDVNGDTAIWAYADAYRQGQDYSVFYWGVLVPLWLANPWFDLRITVGETGFAAGDPGPPPPLDPLDPVGTAQVWGARYYAETNPTFQAGMLVRLLAYFVTLGASRSSWYSFLVGGSYCPPPSDKPERWGPITTNGVHNDILDSTLPDPEGSFLQEEDGWPRPAWFAFRRLVWLLQQTTRALRTKVNDWGLTVLELELDPPLATGPEDPATGGPWVPLQPWTRAYLIWLDQHYVEKWGMPGIPRSVQFEDPTGYLYQGFPVVPTVTVGTDGDANGYANATATWDGGSALAAISNVRLVAAPTGFKINILAADPDLRPSPVCILTHATFFRGGLF